MSPLSTDTPRVESNILGMLAILLVLARLTANAFLPWRSLVGKLTIPTFNTGHLSTKRRKNRTSGRAAYPSEMALRVSRCQPAPSEPALLPASRALPLPLPNGWTGWWLPAPGKASCFSVVWGRHPLLHIDKNTPVLPLQAAHFPRIQTDPRVHWCGVFSAAGRDASSRCDIAATLSVWGPSPLLSPLIPSLPPPLPSLPSSPRTEAATLRVIYRTISATYDRHNPQLLFLIREVKFLFMCVTSTLLVIAR